MEAIQLIRFIIPIITVTLKFFGIDIVSPSLENFGTVGLKSAYLR